MSKDKTCDVADDEFADGEFADVKLVPDTKFRKIIPMSKETQDRRDEDKALIAIGWPVKVKYPGAGPKSPGFRFESHIRTFTQNLLKLALEERKKLLGAAGKQREGAE